MKRCSFKPVGGGLLLGCILVATGCSSQPGIESRNPASQADEVMIVPGKSPGNASRDKMLAAKDALFTRLSGRLMEVMSSRGPGAAIAVCRSEARAIAKAVSDAHGLQIGRTGVRLRNPDNVAPAWAAKLVRDKVDTPTFVILDNGHAAALLPIKLQAQCLMCHGPKDQIAPVVRDQLAKLYPHDQATGFEAGQLRGWFWIDLPNSEP